MNARLVEACHDSGGLFRPVGLVNPALPDWAADLRRCVEEYGMKIIRLTPNYHGYTLEDPGFRDLMAMASEAGLAVQIVAQMEDERTQHPGMRVAPVNLGALPGVLDSMPSAQVMILNTNARMVTTALRDCDRLWLDIAMIESAGGVGSLLNQWPNEKVCFGSFSPLFYWESAMLKLKESALEGETLNAVREANAVQFLKA